MQNTITLILTILSALIGLSAIIFAIVVAVKIFGKKNKPSKIRKVKPAKEQKKVKVESAAQAKNVKETEPQSSAGAIIFEDDEEISLKGVEQQITKFKLDD